MSVNPEGGQTVGRGEAADFFASTRGFEGFGDPISFNIVQWSTQRFPDAQDGSTAAAGRDAAEGRQARRHRDTAFRTAGADPGIYFMRVEASGGGISKTFDLALVLN